MILKYQKADLELHHFKSKNFELEQKNKILSQKIDQINIKRNQNADTSFTETELE